MNVFSVCASILALFASPLAAAAEKTSVIEPAHYGLRVFVFLMLVVGLIVLLAWLLNKTKLGAGMLGQQHADFKIVAVLSVGIKEKIVLLQVGEKQMVVGITAQNIRLISELDQPLAMEAPPSIAFSDLLKKAIRQ